MTLTSFQLPFQLASRTLGSSARDYYFAASGASGSAARRFSCSGIIVCTAHRFGSVKAGVLRLARRTITPVFTLA